MMTRTTLKALWVGGGGILATWLAVSPNRVAPTTQPVAAVRRPASSSEPTAEDLTTQATRLRERSAAVALRPSTRNPFRYKSPKPAPRSAALERAAQPSPVQSPIPTPPSAVLKLSGVAHKAGTRTAIIAGEGQIYLVGEGDSVAGRYTVVKIDPEAVLLRDASGAEQRLVLPQ
jgi:Tfp pilus assembly protein PilP